MHYPEKRLLDQVDNSLPEDHQLSHLHIDRTGLLGGLVAQDVQYCLIVFQAVNQELVYI